MVISARDAHPQAIKFPNQGKHSDLDDAVHVMLTGERGSVA